MPGLRGFGADSGLEMVAARVNPADGMRTCSSLGRPIVSTRDDTAAMSSRATSRPCVGTRNRRSRPSWSIQTSVWSAPPGFSSVNSKRVAATARPAVWMRSLPVAVTRATISTCGAMYTLSWPGTLMPRRRIASASYAQKNMFGSTTGSAETASTFCVCWPACVSSVVACPPAKVVRMISGRLRSVASTSRLIGRHSRS